MKFIVFPSLNHSNIILHSFMHLTAVKNKSFFILICPGLLQKKQLNEVKIAPQKIDNIVIIISAPLQ